MRKGSIFEADPYGYDAGSTIFMATRRTHCDPHRPESNGIGDVKANQCHQAEAVCSHFCTNRWVKAGTGM